MRGSASSPFGQSAEAYEELMGRWSRRLAPQLLRFGGLAEGERVLDVGSGTGSLTFAASQIAEVMRVVGIDRAEAYVAFARARNTDPRISFETADACSLPFDDRSFDRAFSMLVLQFIPDATRAVAEMRRVVRPGGTVTAAVWDDFTGLPHIRLLIDIARVLDPAFDWPLLRPLTGPGELAGLWRELGLLDVEQTSLLIRMEFASFDDYWLPFTKGEGPPGQLLASLSDAARERLKDQVRRAYVANRPDGARSFACVAWACRGTVAGP